MRVTDIDLHGHVKNAVQWQAVEHLLAAGGPDPREPVRARLDYREPLDFGDGLELAVARDGGRLAIGFVTGAGLKAVASAEPLAAGPGYRGSGSKQKRRSSVSL
jgi:acyl-ACP thioesterase